MTHPSGARVEATGDRIARPGRLERRLRSLDGSFEAHIVSFSSREALDGYRADPRRRGHLPLLNESRAVLDLFEVTDVTGVKD